MDIFQREGTKCWSIEAWKGYWRTPLSWSAQDFKVLPSIPNYHQGLLRHVLSLRWQNVSNLMHCLHVLSLRHILSLRGDKTCWKVHSLHVLSLLRQQHYNLSFPSCIVCVCVYVCMHLSVCACAQVCVCTCVCVCICPWQRARPRVCCCVLCLLSLPQSALKWNSVLLWVDYGTTAAHSSVSCVKYDYKYRDWVKMWFDCVLWMSLFDWMACMVWWDRR